MMGSDYKFCQEITNIAVIDLSTAGAVKYSELCEGRIINNSTGTSCGSLDFVWSDDVTFPLTFKVQTEFEGVYNHTSAEVTITQEGGIDFCEYVPEGEESSCGASKCCGMGTRDDGRT